MLTVPGAVEAQEKFQIQIFQEQEGILHKHQEKSLVVHEHGELIGIADCKFGTNARGGRSGFRPRHRSRGVDG
jgi:hypothetical protein